MRLIYICIYWGFYLICKGLTKFPLNLVLFCLHSTNTLHRVHCVRNFTIMVHWTTLDVTWFNEFVVPTINRARKSSFLGNIRLLIGLKIWRQFFNHEKQNQSHLVCVIFLGLCVIYKWIAGNSDCSIALFTRVITGRGGITYSFERKLKLFYQGPLMNGCKNWIE